MKLQLDTSAKTIKVENDVKISDLLKTLKKLFPNGEYEEFTLMTNVTINNWSTPIIIKEKTYPYPYTYPWIIYKDRTGDPDKVWCGSDNKLVDYKLNKGVYNVQL